MRKAIVLGLALTLITASKAYALDFYFGARYQNGQASQINISGDIKAGDSEKFLAFIAQNPVDVWSAAGVIRIESRGGDVVEAVKIAEIVEKIKGFVFVSNICASSCFYIYVAAPVRSPIEAGRIGIHRPYYNQSYFAGLKATEAKQKYEILNDQVVAYLKKRRVPQRIIDKSFSYASDNIYWLSAEDFQEVALIEPWFHEQALAKCGPVTSIDVTWMHCARSLLMMESAVEIDKIVKQMGLRWPEKEQAVIDELLRRLGKSR
jgi:hypothetical protein